MDREWVCECGTVGSVSADDPASTPLACRECGRLVALPAPPEPDPRTLVATESDADSGSGATDGSLANGEWSAEIIPPTVLVLKECGSEAPARSASVMAAIVRDALWIQGIQDPSNLRRVPLRGLVVEPGDGRREVRLTADDGTSRPELTLGFRNSTDAERWRTTIGELQTLLPSEVVTEPPRELRAAAMVRQGSGIPHEEIGPVGFSAIGDMGAEWGLRLRAAIRGADAVIGLRHGRDPDGKPGVRYASGTAVRVPDAAARRDLEGLWYREEVGTLVRRTLLLLLVVAVMSALAQVVGWSAKALNPGQPPFLAVLTWIVEAAPWYAWPVLLVACLGWSRSPGLLRPVGVSILTMTALRWLVSVLAHLAAAVKTGNWAHTPSLLLDPILWAVSLWGAALAMKASIVARESERCVPRNSPGAWPAWWWVPLGASVLHAVLLLGAVAFFRYETSAYLLQPGVDPKLERTASIALQEGLDAGDRSDFSAAERSFQEALASWERLTAPRDVPLEYRTQLGCTLNNLGWLRAREGRYDEAEPYFRRCLAIEEGLAGAVPADPEFRRIIDYARTSLVDLQQNRTHESINAKDDEATRKYEEAVVKSAEGTEDSRTLVKEAIGLWEEILGQVTTDDQRSAAYERLADANHRLAGMEEGFGDLRAAAASLEKGIWYREKVLALRPDRQVNRHNLALARGQLDALREEEFSNTIDRMVADERFADVVALYRSGIRDLDGQRAAGAEGDSTGGRLAYRLLGFARFLTHCPDERFRDTEAAVGHARRATELMPENGHCWHAFALVLYRNGDWQESLSALDQMETKTGEFDGADWYLSAMNLHRLGRRAEAIDARRRGDEWGAAMLREAEQNPVMRLRYEMIRASLESLREEVQDVLNGNDVAGHLAPGAGRFGDRRDFRRRPC